MQDKYTNFLKQELAMNKKQRNRKEEEYYNWKDDWSRLKGISTKDSPHCKYLFLYPQINVTLTTHPKNFLRQIDTTTVDNNLSNSHKK